MESRHTIPASDSSHLSISIPSSWIERAMAVTKATTKSMAMREVILAGLVRLELIKQSKVN